MPVTTRLHNDILDQQTTAVVCLNHNMQISYMNSAAEVLFSTSAIKGQGQHIKDLAHFSEALIARLYEVLAQEHPYVERELSFLLPNLDTTTVDCTISPFFKFDKRKGLLLELYKIDHHIQVVRDNKILKQQEISKDLLRSLAHEIKNPLGGLRGAAQLLELELQDKALQEYTHIIIREADRLHSLIDRLLGPHSRVKLDLINIHEVLEYVRKLIQVEADNGISISTDYDPSIPYIVADREYLVQIFLNITNNALHVLNGQGHIILRTRISRYKTIGSELYKLVGVFDVIDNGPGIPEQLQDSIFYPLVTGRADGTGLGLSIAQSLINEHRGIIEYHRKDNETVFSVIFPLEKNNV